MDTDNDNEKQSLEIELTEAQAAHVEAQAKAFGITRSAYLERLIRADGVAHEVERLSPLGHDPEGLALVRLITSPGGCVVSDRHPGAQAAHVATVRTRDDVDPDQLDAIGKLYLHISGASMQLPGTSLAGSCRTARRLPSAWYSGSDPPSRPSSPPSYRISSTALGERAVAYASTSAWLLPRAWTT